MLPDPSYIPQLAQDYSIASNLHLVLSLLIHEPFKEYYSKEAGCNTRLNNPLSFSRLEKRVASLEARQTLTEAELALLQAQLNRANIPAH